MPVWAANAARALHTYIALLADLNDGSFFLPSERDGDADALPLPTMRVPEREGRQGAAPSIHRSTRRDGTRHALRGCRRCFSAVRDRESDAA